MLLKRILTAIISIWVTILTVYRKKEDIVEYEVIGDERQRQFASQTDPRYPLIM